MPNELIYKELLEILPKERILIDEPMRRHTTFRIGGNADFFLIATSIDEIRNIIKLAKNNDIKIFTVGNGSNILVKDNGIRGITLKLDLKDIKEESNENGVIYTCGSGVTLSQIANKALENELTGFEFAYGIPRKPWWCNLYECWGIWWRDERCRI